MSLAGNAEIGALEQLVARRVAVDRAGQGGAEPDQVGATLRRLDVVGVGKDGFLIAVVVLQGNLHADLVLGALEVDRRRMERVPSLVEEGDEFDETPFEEVGVAVTAALVSGADLESLVQEGELPQPVRDELVAELHCLEYLGVRLEHECRTGSVDLFTNLERCLRDAPPVALAMDATPLPHFHDEPLRQSIDN